MIGHMVQLNMKRILAWIENALMGTGFVLSLIGAPFTLAGAWVGQKRRQIDCMQP